MPTETPNFGPYGQHILTDLEHDLYNIRGRHAVILEQRATRLEAVCSVTATALSKHGIQTQFVPAPPTGPGEDPTAYNAWFKDGRIPTLMAMVPIESQPYFLKIAGVLLFDPDGTAQQWRQHSAGAVLCWRKDGEHFSDLLAYVPGDSAGGNYLKSGHDLRAFVRQCLAVVDDLGLDGPVRLAQLGQRVEDFANATRRP